MNIDITTKENLRIRTRLSEFLAALVLRGILTSKYPPNILDTEFFEDMNQEEKVLLKNNWNTFDVFKPVFEIEKEIPKYIGFILYEVKSTIRKKENGYNNPYVGLSTNQKKFFDVCKEKRVPFKIFYVVFKENWNMEYFEADLENCYVNISHSSAWNEERMKRIKASKLNQFWNELFPEYVLYKEDNIILNAREKD